MWNILFLFAACWLSKQMDNKIYWLEIYAMFIWFGLLFVT